MTSYDLKRPRSYESPLRNRHALLQMIEACRASHPQRSPVLSYPVRLLVTGGFGFLGRAVVSAAHQQHPDWHIMSLDVEASSSPEAED